ncbi:MAG: class I SAM-dependent methyltransferase [Gammaproteobacteria bacterium]|nr:class I SAM-dependent methyltransferase [Gammaproteobacteria bacterium]
MTVERIDFSMLPPATLRKLVESAASAHGGILEVGPYVGGSTVALAMGNRGRVRHAAIEIGGRYMEHPTVPSEDIVADWQRNVERFNFSDAVRLIPGSSYRYSVRRDAVLHTGKIGLLFVDADGNIEGTLRAFAPYLLPDAILVIDDYITDAAAPKAAKVRPFIDAAISQKLVTENEVIVGTWFGALNGEAAREHLQRLPPFVPDQDNCYMAYIESYCPADTLDAPTRSRLCVFEDGLPLGPAHSMHADIRESGSGRFSHWDGGATGLSCLFFSSSDNSNPNTNGRRYIVDMGHGPIDLRLL